MPQTEELDTFSRFQAARMVARIETDPAYEPFPGTFVQTSGTAIVAEQTGSEILLVEFWRASAREYVFDVTTSIPFEIDSNGNGPSEASDSRTRLTGDTRWDTEAGEDAHPTRDLREIVDFARGHGLDEVANRLIDIGERTLGNDEVPLQTASAKCFVEYCIARQKQGRPLMTPTPTGELDVTWKGSEGEQISMRYFRDETVWVAYKLSKERGSFESAASDLMDPDLHFKIPHWA